MSLNIDYFVYPLWKKRSENHLQQTTQPNGETQKI